VEYHLQALDGARFQKLCQALLVREFEGVQCLPVGMADGGRDAHTALPSAAGQTVFQMKFSNGLRAQRNPATTIIAAFAKELPSVRALAAAGATQYVIITNLSGSAVPGTGAVDTVQAYLDANSPIPAMCWWQDDVKRRLDAAADVRLSYPEILSAADVLPELLRRLPDPMRLTIPLFWYVVP